MSYSMLVAGAVTLPAGRAADYLGSVVDPSAHHDWIGTLENGTDVGPAGTAEQVLRQLPRQVITKAGSWLEVELPERTGTAGQLAVRGVLVEDDFLDHGVLLAAAFRVAAACGGQGELYFLEEQVPHHPQEPEYCYVVRVAPPRSRLEYVPEKEQERVVRGPLFAPVLRRLEEELGPALEAAGLDRSFASGGKDTGKVKVSPMPPASKKASPASAAKGGKKPAGTRAPKPRRG
jgi:hypothetical protein